MVLVMGVTLFTSRIILKSLGIEDFGIYSIVGGSVSFFMFISNSMALALQRFYTYELGRENKDRVALYFNQGFWTFVLVSIIIVILSETFGLSILKYYLDIPEGKQTVAFWVFQLSVLSLIFTLLRTPYNALFIAYEKMDYFAILGIVEVLLKLGITYVLLLFSSNRLIIYMILISIVSFLILEFTIYYCRRIKIDEKIKFDIDKPTIFKLLSFSGWTTLTSGANVLSNQGVNMVLNNIFGVLISAATGVANQVMSAVMTFLGSFQTAFNPQIVKSYASHDINKFINLLYTMSLLSFYLMMIVGIPVIIKMQTILDIWLVNVPEWTSIFSICIILSMMVESYAGPFWMGMQNQEISDHKFNHNILKFLCRGLIVILWMFAGMGIHHQDNGIYIGSRSTCCHAEKGGLLLVAEILSFGSGKVVDRVLHKFWNFIFLISLLQKSCRPDFICIHISSYFSCFCLSDRN